MLIEIYKLSPKLLSSFIDNYIIEKKEIILNSFLLVQDKELGSSNHKLVNIYHYEDMNTFDSGQTFGFIVLVKELVLL